MEISRLIFGALIPPQGRRLRNEIDGFTISTVNSYDQGWETAIVDSNGAFPVQRYADENSASIGHTKWIQFIASGKRQVTELGFDDFLEPREVTLRKGPARPL